MYLNANRGPLGAVQNMAFLAVLDGNDDALEATRRLLASSRGVDRISPPPRSIRERFASSYGCPLSRAYDLIQPELSAAERRFYCGWAVKSVIRGTIDWIWPAHFRAAGMNFYMGQLFSLFDALMAVDGDEGVPDLSKEWRSALQLLEATLNSAIGPNGYPIEDMGYGTGMMAGIAPALEALRRAGIYDVYKEAPQYAEFGNALLHFVQPWGECLSNTGDHGDYIRQRHFILARQAEETKNPAILWLLKSLSYSGDIDLGKGKSTEVSMFSLLTSDCLSKGVPPAKLKPQMPTQFHDPDRGIVTFRSGWDAKAAFVVFDGCKRSSMAPGHEHASCGHFSLSAFGEYFSIDTGRYNNEQKYHSVVLIDGKSGRSTDGQWARVKHAGMLTSFAPGDFVDSAAVDSSLQHNCFWARRHLGLVKGKGMAPYVWVVDDINKNDDWAEYWWQLHTSPENKIRVFARHATVTGWRHGNKMDVHFVLPGADEYSARPHELVGLMQDEPGTSSHTYVTPSMEAEAMKRLQRPSDQVHYATFSRPRLVAKIAGVNGKFMSLMLPREKDTKPAKVKRLKSLPGSLAVEVTSGNVVDAVIFAYDHKLLEANGTKERGNWCVIRRRSKDGKILERAVG